MIIYTCPDCGREVSRVGLKCRSCSRLHTAGYGTTVQKVLANLGQPGATMASIAREVGVSRERIAQIRDRFQLCQFMPVHRRVKRFCQCGNLLNPVNKGTRCQTCRSNEARLTLLCEWCRRQFTRKKGIQHQLQRRSKSHKDFCSRKCAHLWNARVNNCGKPKSPTLNLVCARCGKEFTRKASYFYPGQREFLCSRACRYGWTPKKKTPYRVCHQCGKHTTTWHGFLEVDWVLCDGCFGNRDVKGEA